MGDVTPCCGLLMVYKHTWFIMNNKLSLRGSDDSGLCCSYMQQYKPESLMWALFIISLCLAVPPLGWEYLGSLLGSSSVSPLCHQITGTCKLAKGGKVRHCI